MQTKDDLIIISNEDEAFDSLQKSLHQELGENANIQFDGWPLLNLTISGKDFKSSIPTRIMPPILELQKEIFRIYCITKYSTEDIKRLTKAERELLELVVIIKSGSTWFSADIWKILNEIIKNSNMSGAQVVTVILGIAALIASSSAWKEWVQSNERTHFQEVTVELSKQETERTKILKEAISSSSELKRSDQAIDDFRTSLASKLEPSDQLNVNDTQIITGEHASEILSEPKNTARDVRLDGKYAVNQVKFPSKLGGMYRFNITRLSDDKTFMADAEPDLLSKEQIDIIRDGSFGLKYLNLSINAKDNKGTISGAKIISIDWAKEDSEN